MIMSLHLNPLCHFRDHLSGDVTNKRRDLRLNDLEGDGKISYLSFRHRHVND